MLTAGQQGGGRAVLYIENSYIDMDNLDIKDNSYGILMKSSSGSFTNSRSGCQVQRHRHQLPQDHRQH